MSNKLSQESQPPAQGDGLGALRQYGEGENINPDAVEYWGEIWKIYHGDICRCAISVMGYSTNVSWRVKRSTGRCELCGLKIEAKERII